MTQHQEVRPVVSGVDGTADGISAAEYGARMAVDRDCPLMLVHAFRRSPAIAPLVPMAYRSSSGAPTAVVAYSPYLAGDNLEVMRAAGIRALEAAEARVRLVHPRLEVETILKVGKAAAVLTKASRRASVVVVARNHARSTERFFAGSTSSAVAAHADSPVVVVPDNWASHERRNRVVVGLDGSHREVESLTFAFDEARREHAELAIIHAWSPSASRHNASKEGWQEEADAEERMATAVLDPWLTATPDVACSVQVWEGSPAEALISAGDGADIVVVGARGRGGLRGLPLGATARAVIAKASCPVAVVRHK